MTIYYINRKRYNTETADEIAEFSWSNGRGDNNWYEDILYVTKKGNFFLVGEGNASSKWAYACDGGGFSPGSGALAYTKEDAYDRLRDEGQLDEWLIEKYFSDIVEDG